MPIEAHAQFGFRMVVAPNGTLHVLLPYSQHFSRKTSPDGPNVRLSTGGYCLDPRTGKMLYGY